MIVLKEHQYLQNYPNSLVHFEKWNNLPYEVGAQDLISGQQLICPYNVFDLNLIKIQSARVYFPNVLISGNDELIDTNNGYHSTELIDHQIDKFPIQKKDDKILLNPNFNSISVDMGAYVCAMDNYAGFVMGELPRLQFYNQYCPKNFPVILHGNVKTWHIELLSNYGILESRLIVIPAECSVRAKALYFVTPTYLHHQIFPCSVHFLKNISTGLALDQCEGIYFSRSKLGYAADRKIINEHDFQAELKNHGFRILYPELLTPIDQFRYFLNSHTLISPFGAVWANSIFRSSRQLKSIMLATKFTPEFCRIFQLNNNLLNYCLLPGKKVREGRNYSSTHEFILTDEVIYKIIQLIKK